MRLSLGLPQALPWSRTCPLWPCPQSRPDAGELEEVPPSQTSSLGEQKRELADSVDGVTARVCVGTQRCGATLTSLKPGVLAEEGSMVHSCLPFHRGLSSEAGQPGPCLGISTCACSWPGRPSLWVGGVQRSLLCRYPNREPVADLSTSANPQTALLGHASSPGSARCHPDVMHSKDSGPITEDIARPEGSARAPIFHIHPR